MANAAVRDQKGPEHCFSASNITGGKRTVLIVWRTCVPLPGMDSLSSNMVTYLVGEGPLESIKIMGANGNERAAPARESDT